MKRERVMESLKLWNRLLNDVDVEKKLKQKSMALYAIHSFVAQSLIY
jgi:hypothetical protein